MSSPLFAARAQLRVTRFGALDTPLAVCTGVGGAAGVTGSEAGDSGEFPISFVATTVKLYEVPLVRPEIWQLVATVEQVAPPGVAVTTYAEIDEPLPAEACHETVTADELRTAVIAVGTVGTSAGVTVFDACD